MIEFIDCEHRLTAEEHFYLFTYYQSLNGREINYLDFHIRENFIEKYNELPLRNKEDIEKSVINNPNYYQFLISFNQEPWKYEKPVLWKDRRQSDNFIKQLELSHAFEVFIDCKFKQLGVDIGLYYGRNEQYSGESDIGIEIKYDKRSDETNNFYIEYQERMWKDGPWVNSGILKDDNSKFFLYGTMSRYVIFKKETLLDYYKRLMNGEKIPGIKLVQEQQHNTSKGFIIKPEVWKGVAISMEQFIRMFCA